MASDQGETPGNGLIFTFCGLQKQRLYSEAALRAYLFASLSAGVWNIFRILRSFIVSSRNHSTEYQLRRLNGGPDALASFGLVRQHLVERPRHPEAQVQGCCRGDSLSRHT